MKKVLILAYDFPPYVSVGGLRPYNWYKHFKEFNLYPIVVTRQWDNKYKNHFDYVNKSQSKTTIVEETTEGTVLRTPYTPNISNRLMLRFGDKKFIFIRKIITFYFEILQFIFTIGPKKNMYLEADHYLEDNKVDFILATGEPFVLFHYANKLSEKYDIPWIADYRDPWSLHTQNMVSPLLKPWFDIQERRLIKKMNLILTVSEYLTKKINNFNPNKVPIYIIPNGYDSDATDKVRSIKQNSNALTFSFAGTIYPYHPYYEVLETIKDFSQDNPSLEFNLHFYGVNLESELKKIIDKDFYIIKKYIHFFPKLPNQKLLVELATSNVLILFNEYSFLGTKIYDYLGVDRFILLCFSNDERANQLKEKYFPMNDEEQYSNKLQEDLIQFTNTGIAVKDTLELKKILAMLYNKFSTERKISTNSIHRDSYSRKSQTEKLAKIILEKFR